MPHPPIPDLVLRKRSDALHLWKVPATYYASVSTKVRVQGKHGKTDATNSQLLYNYEFKKENPRDKNFPKHVSLHMPILPTGESLKILRR